MSFSPIPNFPLTLPSSSLTVKAPTTALLNRQDRLPSLKVVITCRILIPTPLITERVIGRKVDECVEFMVPVGGGVGISINVDEEGLGAVNQNEGEVEGFIKRRVRDHLRWNKEALGLTSITKGVKPAGATDNADANSAHDFKLHTITATPSHSPTANQLIPPGVPVAVLQQIDLQVSWYIPTAITNFTRNRREGDVEGEDAGASQEKEQGDSGNDEAPDKNEDENEDDFLLESDAEESQEVVQDGDAFLLDDLNPVAEEALDTSSLTHWTDRDGPLPLWASKQLQEAMSKLIKQHLIKRFPLIFDASLIRYTPSITLPSSLSSSIAQFLSISATHHTNLAQNVRQVLTSIWEEQETYLKYKLQQAEDLPARKDKPKGRKKKRLDQDGSSQDSNDSGNGKGKRRRRQNIVEQEEEVVEKMGVYVAELRERLERDDSAEMGRRHVRRITRVLGEAVGRIGRSHWDDARKGKGKLAFWRIPVIDEAPEGEDDDTGNEASDDISDSGGGLVPSVANARIKGGSDTTDAGIEWREQPEFDDGDFLSDNDDLLSEDVPISAEFFESSDDEGFLLEEDAPLDNQDSGALQQNWSTATFDNGLLYDDAEMLDDERLIIPPEEYPLQRNELQPWGKEDEDMLSHASESGVSDGMDFGEELESLFDDDEDVAFIETGDESMRSYKYPTSIPTRSIGHLSGRPTKMSISPPNTLNHEARQALHPQDFLQAIVEDDSMMGMEEADDLMELTELPEVDEVTHGECGRDEGQNVCHGPPLF